MCVCVCLICRHDVKMVDHQACKPRQMSNQTFQPQNHNAEENDASKWDQAFNKDPENKTKVQTGPLLLMWNENRQWQPLKNLNWWNCVFPVCNAAITVTVEAPQLRLRCFRVCVCIPRNSFFFPEITSGSRLLFSGLPKSDFLCGPRRPY